jgi:hypothetical protein
MSRTVFVRRMYAPMYFAMCRYVYGASTANRATYGATYGLKNAKRTRISEKRVFDKRKSVFLGVCVDKPTDFKSPPMMNAST